MLALVHPEPTSLLALGAMAAAFIISLMALAITRSRSGKAPSVAEKKSRGSMLGVFVQMIGFAAVGFGPIVASLDPHSTLAISEAGVVAVLMAFTILLFFSASRAMGKNWSIVARTREDHQLVTWGPFAAIRHPIYTGLFAFMLAMAVAFGHWRGLILGVPLYWIGTWMRVSIEERMLRGQFGAAYDAYAARVKRFVPGVI
ncbi:MAG: isoprenylcysteine carboxylmethyltransferase family protein [Sphingomonas sp.]|uniref:methyltransferase family protein n=1 Tax=Sphingomonas sp. TaxID=28214 RepID=UPI0025E7FED4|nr:isoprenylcysteine carboxylmethyltransferase family protein [Sphingomonas sp.]MBX3565079.1 isoprenylcysteine carboxylmethyltransferase family protein [Sphingomonas sp.]